MVSDKENSQIAIDFNLIPYYGEPSPAEAPFIYRSKAKSGTCSFQAYATVYVIKKNKRVTLAIKAVQRQDTLVAIITYLLALLEPIQLKIERLYLDREFFCVPVIRWLQALDVPCEMPAIIRQRSGRAGTRDGKHGGKKVKGRKRHLLVDTEGLVLKVKVEAANLSAREGAMLLLAGLKETFH